ncbi:inner membrane protein YiaA [Paraburkholderia sp. EG287A]|uniref:inner membrane protein YiaA n=1 Tax=Paraburkholderia sp. EG287A TaxID=3237012 RepID=UPI0034D2C82D
MSNNQISLRPTSAFIGASWACLVLGMGAYLIGLWNGPMAISEKGFYFGALMLGLFAAVSLQKTVRDRIEGIPVTHVYNGMCWAGLLIALAMLTVGLFNATFDLAVKGFYAMAYLLSLFAVVTVQKNVRDMKAFRGNDGESMAAEPDSRLNEAS